MDPRVHKNKRARQRIRNPELLHGRVCDDKLAHNSMCVRMRQRAAGYVKTFWCAAGCVKRTSARQLQRGANAVGCTRKGTQKDWLVHNRLYKEGTAHSKIREEGSARDGVPNDEPAHGRVYKEDTE